MRLEADSLAEEIDGAKRGQGQNGGQGEACRGAEIGQMGCLGEAMLLCRDGRHFAAPAVHCPLINDARWR
ncbi:hypothetical protein D3C86_1806730 [compost metagenome]